MRRVTEITDEAEHEVLDITAEPVVRERMLEMGVSPGRGLRVIKRLPFGGPIIVSAGSISIALRHEEAGCVWVK